MKTRKYLCLLLCLALPLWVMAQSGTIPFDSKVKTGQLPNGLKYFILQNKKPEQKVELRLAVNVGSTLEDSDQLGLAHMMEHMNFNGLKHFPKNEVVHYLQSIGVSFGADLNAYTDFDETVYILPIPSDDRKKVEQGFQILADWSGAALLEKGEIDKERGVVLEESRLHKSADERMMKKWLPEALKGSLYAERLPIGKDEMLKTFKPEVLKRFHRDWYRPNLQAVIVAGDMDPNEAERLIKEKFSGFKNPSKERPRPQIIPTTARADNKTMVLSDPEAAHTAVQIIGNFIPSKKAATEAEYLEEVGKNLFNTMLSLRFEELRNSPNPPFIFAGGGLEGRLARNWENFQLMAACGKKKKVPTATLR